MYNWEEKYGQYLALCTELGAEKPITKEQAKSNGAESFEKLISSLQESLEEACTEKDKQLMKELSADLFEDSVSDMIASTGEDINRPGLMGTPDRVRRMWKELYGGYDQDPRALLRSAIFPNEGSQEMVVVAGIDFHSTCEHHLMPFFGKVHVGYIPGKEGVIGLSKIPRAVNALARRMQIQEQLGRQIASAFMDMSKDAEDASGEKNLGTLGVIVVIEARHMCVEARGVKNKSYTMTVHREGLFRENHDLKHEFMSLITTGGPL